MSAPIEIQVGQIWKHMVFGVITITEVKRDCNGAPWYIAEKADGTVTPVMPRNPGLPFPDRFEKLISSN